MGARRGTVTQAVCGYTNHTLLPEALEQWPVALFERVLPRHLQIIYEINHRLLQEVRARFPGDEARVQRMSLVAEGPTPHVRMANLALAGSHKVNGVAAMHSELVKRTLFPDFHAMWPERFTNKTNGITPRRWLLRANPALSAFITERIGDGWITDLATLRDLEPYADDAASQDAFLADQARVQGEAREAAERLDDRARRPGLAVRRPRQADPRVQAAAAERAAPARRVSGASATATSRPAPRVHVFAGKAAPGYARAKLIIKCINSVADLVNDDPASAAGCASRSSPITA